MVVAVGDRRRAVGDRRRVPQVPGDGGFPIVLLLREENLRHIKPLHGALGMGEVRGPEPGNRDGNPEWSPVADEHQVGDLEDYAAASSTYSMYSS